MTTTTPENRREFWKFQSAAIAFQNAESLALRLQSMTDRDELFYPLLTALHVTYSRPFKHQEAALRIPAELVPKSHFVYHEALLYCRDKIFAHHDRKAARISLDDREEFASLVILVKGGEAHASQMFPYQHPNEMPKTAELCKLLATECATRLGHLAEKCLGPNPALPDGMYIVSSTFEGDAPLLKGFEV